MGPLADILAERESAYQAASKSPVAASAAASAAAGAKSAAASASASSSAASATAAVVAVAEPTNHMLPIQARRRPASDALDNSAPPLNTPEYYQS